MPQAFVKNRVWRVGAGVFALASWLGGPAGAQGIPEWPRDVRGAQKDVKECSGNGTPSVDPSCDRQWHLKQTGLLKARDILQEKLGTGAEAGQGVVVAQIDTGVIDQPTVDSPHNGDADLSLDQIHPLLRPGPGRPHQIVVTTTAGDRLPLNFYSDRLGRRSGCAASTHPGQECAARDAYAEVAPRDFIDGPGIPGFIQVASAVQQPGHGTRTMSVLLQAAPGVSVVPYKFAGGALLTQGRSTQLAHALRSVAMEDRLAAGNGRVDVTTMSVGRRSPASELENAVRVAEANGIILVAAAGQLPLIPRSTTRFPAQYDGVIAVTGTQADLKPWRFAGRGPRNAIAAPAKGVWRASWEREGKQLNATFGRGSGTSFAAPLVAATAAMWIQYHGRHCLDERYGRAAVPAAFRWVLTRKGFRTPTGVCNDLLGRDPTEPWKSICEAARNEESWDAERWGPGILAADKVLEAELPTAGEVCQDVMEHRGPTQYALVCPPGTPGYSERHLALAPQLEKPSARTWVTGVSALGSTFGRDTLVAPTVSLGVIWSEHEIEAPRGWFTQAELGHRGDFKLGLGGAFAAEYSPQGHSRRIEAGKLPGFGPAIGAALKAVFISTRENGGGRSERRGWLGPELEIVFYRWRVQGAWVRTVDSGRKESRFVWGLGWGF